MKEICMIEWIMEWNIPKRNTEESLLEHLEYKMNQLNQ